MSASAQSTLPQGFSVYQQALGAQLQFFPALGTQQLDDLVNTYVPGPASVKEKRASVSLDFLEYAQITGQTFKFYPVYSTTASATASPLTGSPSLDSVSSSFNASLVNSSWDWSATASVSSQSSGHARRSAKAASPRSRHQTTDFSSLPGMKILTKDGLDVTNSASRGSKTKEQRDHAHLMRIIKACESCRRKKIRCDPSHKKRASNASQAQSTVSAASVSKQSKKAKRVSQEPSPRSQAQSQPQTTALRHPEHMVVDQSDSLNTSYDFDPNFSFASLESLDMSSAALTDDVWNDFMQFPDVDAVADYDFFADPENYFSSQPSSQSSSSLASPDKVSTPQSQPDTMAPPGSDMAWLDALAVSQPVQDALADLPGAGTDYADFDLFSPQSTFSEDDRMLTVGAPLGLPVSGLVEPGSPYAPPRALYGSDVGGILSRASSPMSPNGHPVGYAGDTPQSSVSSSSAAVVGIQVRDKVVNETVAVDHADSALHSQLGSPLGETRMRLAGGLPEPEEEPRTSQHQSSGEAFASIAVQSGSISRSTQQLAEIGGSTGGRQDTQSRGPTPSPSPSPSPIDVNARAAAPQESSPRRPQSTTAEVTTTTTAAQKPHRQQPQQQPVETDALNAARAAIPVLAPFVANLLSSTVCWMYMAKTMSEASKGEDAPGQSRRKQSPTSCGRSNARVQARSLSSQGLSVMAMAA